MSDENGDKPPPPETTKSTEDTATKQEDQAPLPTEPVEEVESEDESTEQVEEVEDTEETSDDSETAPELVEADDDASTDDGETEESETQSTATENATAKLQTVETAATTETATTTAAAETTKSTATEQTVSVDTNEDDDSGSLVVGGDVMPHGFENGEQASEFTQALNDGLDEAGYTETQAAFQGSSVTGVGFKTGEPFGDHSDYDIALGGEDIFNAAKEAGVGLRSRGTRTGPLTPAQVDQLGLSDMQAQLEEMSGREVKFMVYRSIDGALNHKPSMLVPRDDEPGGRK